MATADDDQGFIPLQGQKQAAPVAVAPVVAAPPKPVIAKPVDPNDQGFVPLHQPPAQTGGGQDGGQQSPPAQGWGVNWRTGNVTMPP